METVDKDTEQHKKMEHLDNGVHRMQVRACYNRYTRIKTHSGPFVYNRLLFLNKFNKSQIEYFNHVLNQSGVHLPIGHSQSHPRGRNTIQCEGFTIFHWAGELLWTLSTRSKHCFGTIVQVDVKWFWEKEQQEAFNECKKLLAWGEKT